MSIEERDPFDCSGFTGRFLKVFSLLAIAAILGILSAWMVFGG